MKAQRVICVLSSLMAEGTPRLALDLCRVWKEREIEVLVVTLFAEPAELVPELDALGIAHRSLGLPPGRGYGRYLRMAEAMLASRGATGR